MRPHPAARNADCGTLQLGQARGERERESERERERERPVVRARHYGFAPLCDRLPSNRSGASCSDASREGFVSYASAPVLWCPVGGHTRRQALLAKHFTLYWSIEVPAYLRFRVQLLFNTRLFLIDFEQSLTLRGPQEPDLSCAQVWAWCGRRCRGWPARRQSD